MKYQSKNKRIIFFVTVIVLLLAVINLCDLFTVESSFQLASTSALPRWFAFPNYSRNDLSMEITYYTGGKAKIVVRGPLPERKILAEKIGTVRWHPMSEPKRNEVTKYPSYDVITVDGVDEIFEQKAPGNILYVCDDPRITSGYIK